MYPACVPRAEPISLSIVASNLSPVNEPHLTHQAYCYELERNITTEEIWQLLFKKKYPRSGLTFKCADPECEARLTLRKCYAYAPSSVGFRRYNGQAHRVGCTYIKALNAKRYAALKRATQTRLYGCAA